MAELRKLIDDLESLETNMIFYKHKIEAKTIRDAIELLTGQHKNGHWIEQEGFDSDVYYDCSVCGASWVTVEGTPEDNEMFYCPHCGAKMDEQKEGERNG